MDIGYKIVTREAIELVKMPSSVKVAFDNGSSVTVNRQKAPGTVWKDRNIDLDFEKWPVVLIKRQPYGEWETPHQKVLFQTIEVNVASPNGMYQLGKTIELLLGL